MNFPAVYLASRSPRRRELLAQLAVNFAVIAPDIDESVKPSEKPADYVMRIAIEKARSGRAMLAANETKPVLAADTAVILDDDILGKPTDKNDARRMLKMLSGKVHQVMTAVALASSEQLLTRLSVNEVCFAPLHDDEIDWYVATGEGRDKAGSYAVQGLGALFIDRIEGSYSGIMGLPIRETGQLLMQIDSQ